jgi:large subunit ribosomal protein L22
MTGPKTNEGATRVGERVGTRAQVRYIRASATKAREVLDLIRGKSVRDADAILQFVERDIGIVVRKVLASAVANAEHNDSQDPEELFVAACFADEGPTLKRFRPRARGRATRVRKRTCHITVVVARMSDAQLEQLRRKEERQPARGRRGRIGGRAATSRRERVARSRQAAAGQGAAHDNAHDHEHDHDESVEALEAVEDSDEAIDAELESDVNVGEPTEEMVDEAEEAEVEGDGVTGAQGVDDDVNAGEPTAEMVTEAEEADHQTEAEEADHQTEAEEADHQTEAEEADHQTEAEEADHQTEAEEADHETAADTTEREDKKGGS